MSLPGILKESMESSRLDTCVGYNLIEGGNKRKRKKKGIRIICGKSKTNPCHSTAWVDPDSSTQITSLAPFILEKEFLRKGCGRYELLHIYCQIYIYILAFPPLPILTPLPGFVSN